MRTTTSFEGVPRGVAGVPPAAPARRSLLVFALALALAAGCGGSRAARCVDKSQCGPGMECLDGLCLYPGDGPSFCQDVDDCPDGQHCDGNVCLPGGGDSGPAICVIDNDCRAGWFCSQAVHLCVECLIDEHCPDLQERCLPDGSCGVATTCDDDGDCPVGHCLILGGLGACVECYVHGHCPLGSFCNTFSYTCQDAGTDTGCTALQCAASGQVCDEQSGACRACDGNSECPAGQVCRQERCQPCTDTLQCTPPQECDLGLSPARCVYPGGAGDRPLGANCEQSSQCQSSLCVQNNGPGFCSRRCIGTGKGEPEDCPLGFACAPGAGGTPYDGIFVCLPADLLSGAIGYPFSTPPGGACQPYNSTCQTSTCQADGTCARQCLADRDCDSDETCWSRYGMFELPVGQHICSQPQSYTDPAGELCLGSADCASGICAGLCVDWLGQAVELLCNSSWDCPDLSYNCLGRCRVHCRNDGDCPAAQVCTAWPLDPAGVLGRWDGDLWTMICLDPSCSPPCANLPDGALCADDLQCASEWCIGGTCTSPCVLDADCAGSGAGPSCRLRDYLVEGNVLLFKASFCLP